MRLYLIGLPGVGKSTVGKMLAEKIGYRFIDLDTYIEQKAMMFIDEIFQAYGETYFRALETKALQEMTKEDQIVVACGGGIVKEEKNKELFLGPCIYMTAPIQMIQQRLEESVIERPLLQIKRIEDLEEERKKLYENFKTIQIENVNLEQTVSKIIEEVGL